MNEISETQPNQPAAKRKRGGAFLFNALGLIVILVLAGLGAYRAGIAARLANEKVGMSQKMGEQFQLALVDMEFERYEIAQQRFEWILKKDPTFPGAQEKLTEVLVKINTQASFVPPTETPSPVPTPDFSGAQEAFAHADQFIRAQDWPGAISALDSLRKLDVNYQQSQVDGMYYFALRSYGYALITQKGNLEGGIYQLTLAERFGMLDRDTNGLREGARYYLLGASFWDLDWEQAVYYFTQVYGGWPSLWDGTMTASERFRIASMRYGDQLLSRKQYCDAYTQYENAQKVGNLDAQATSGFNEARQVCFPATATPTLPVSPTSGGAPTDTQQSPPTETVTPPTETLTPTP